MKKLILFITSCENIFAEINNRLHLCAAIAKLEQGGVFEFIMFRFFYNS